MPRPEEMNNYKTISVKLSSEEHQKLIEYTKAHSLTKSDVVRQCLSLLLEIVQSKKTALDPNLQRALEQYLLVTISKLGENSVYGKEGTKLWKQIHQSLNA